MSELWSLEQPEFERWINRFQEIGQMSPQESEELHELYALEAETQTHEHWPTGPPTIRGGAILRDTDRLWNSLGANGRDSIREVSARWARYGTAVWYARTHNDGAIIRAVNAKYLRFQVGPHGHKQWVSKKQVVIPQRRFMRTEQEMQQPLLEVTRDWLRVRKGI